MAAGVLRRIDVSHRPPVTPAPCAVPLLDWIEISRLVIDDSYQRPLNPSNWAAIDAIAASFSWTKFAPVLVAPVEGGFYAVVDGQHRAHAAMICGHERVPAMIVPMDLRAQAAAFAWVNGQVTRVTPIQMYRAALAAGEGWAERCDHAVAMAGCRLMTYNKSHREKKPGEVFAIGMVRRAVKRGHADRLTAALAALREYDAAGRPALWTDYILRPWIDACTAAERSPRVDLVGVLRLRDPFKVLEDAARETLGIKTPGRAAEMFGRMIADAPLKERAA